MNKINHINRFRQSRIYSGGGTGCQDKSEDQIGILLERIIDGLLDPEASKAAQEKAGQALEDLVQLRVWGRIGSRIQSEGADIKRDTVAGVLEALEKMRNKRCFAARATPASRRELRKYLYGIVENQIKSAIRKAVRNVSRQQAIAWQPWETDEHEEVHPLDKEAFDDFRLGLKRHAPTTDEIRTLSEEAALRGELFGAAFYDLCLDVCLRKQMPAPAKPKAPDGMSDRTRNRRERAGEERLRRFFGFKPTRPKKAGPEDPDMA
jgi:DNA-directed RNA polymerase specialized sigma24 family protein